MRTFPKKRLEAFVEAPVLRRFTDILGESGVTGYTVMPVLGGTGRQGDWSREGSLTGAGQMACVVCILDEDLLDQILGKTFDVLSLYIGLVSVSDCRVMRPDNF